MKLLADDGFDDLGDAIRRAITEAMCLERQHHFGFDLVPMNVDIILYVN